MMKKKVEYINPKTKVVREVEEDYELKITALKRAGFVLKSTYRAPKERAVEPKPTLAEKVEEHGEEAGTSEVEKAAEKAIHGEAAPPESGEGDKSGGELEPDANEPETDGLDKFVGEEAKDEDAEAKPGSPTAIAEDKAIAEAAKGKKSVASRVGDVVRGKGKSKDKKS